MDLKTIEEAVKVIPKLIELTSQQDKEIRSLKQIIEDMAKDDALDTKGVSEYTGYAKRNCWEIMREAGASKMHGKIWIRKSKLIDYLMTNPVVSNKQKVKAGVDKVEAQRRREQLYGNETTQKRARGRAFGKKVQVEH